MGMLLGRIVAVFFRKILGSHWFGRAYQWSLSGSESQSANSVVLKLALRTAGFNPPDTCATNGELKVARTLVDMGCRSALDIGANVGNYSSMLIDVGFERVYAFEPHPESFRDLEEISRASRGRISAHQLAMGESEGKETLRFHPDALVLASLSSEARMVPYVEFSDQIEVEVSSIDDFCHDINSVDFVKVDTEGFECQVLMGGSTTFSRLQPIAVQLEFNHHHLFTGDSIWSLHGKLGEDYRAYRLLPGDNGVVEVDASSPYANVFLFSNYIFVRGEHSEAFERKMNSI